MTKRKKKSNKKGLLGSNILSEPTLFDEEEGTFIDNRSRRRVFVHLVPAPWSRVIAISFIYAIAVTFTTQIIFAFYGKPEWHAVDVHTIETFLHLSSK